MMTHLPKPFMRTRAFIAAALAAASLLVSYPASAELIATPLRGDTRLVEFQFDPDNTFLVLSKPRAVTHLQFAADEQIMSVAAGDTSNWEITPTKNRKNLFLKPKFEDLETSLTVLTDKRPYQFVLKSTTDGKKWYQRVSWVYSSQVVLEFDPAAASDAEEAASAAAGGNQGPGASTPAVRGEGPAGINPGAMRFSYRIEGDAKFRPEIVFDDGRFTYFRMPADLQEQPALFAVIEGNDFSLVNYTVNGNFIVAQRLLDNAVLKLGKPEVRVTRVEEKRNWFGHVVKD